MWAGIKHALNSTLGTNDFKSLDKLQKEQFEALEDYIRYKNHDLLYDFARSDTNTNSFSLWAFPPRETEASNLTITKYSAGAALYNKVILGNNIVYIGDLQSWGRNGKDIVGLFLPQSEFEIGKNAFSTLTGLTYIKLPKNIKKIASDAFAPTISASLNITLVDCEFSEERARELGYRTGNAWGYTGTIRFNVK